MHVFGLDIASIVELGTHVAQAGAMRADDTSGTDVFDSVIGVVLLVYEMDPGEGDG
jgi:hypothetical protein